MKNPLIHPHPPQNFSSCCTEAVQVVLEREQKVFMDMSENSRNGLS